MGVNLMMMMRMMMMMMMKVGPETLGGHFILLLGNQSDNHF